MILWVRGDPFPAGAINDLTLRDLQAFDRWLMRYAPQAIDHWWELPAMAAEYAALDDEGKADHPARFLLLAVRLWATLRKAGLDHTFDEVLVVAPSEVRVSDLDERETADSLPRGFRAGNVQGAEPMNGEEVDLEHEVYSRLLDVMERFPAVTPVNVWDVPLFVWRGMAARVDALRRKG